MAALAMVITMAAGAGAASRDDRAEAPRLPEALEAAIFAQLARTIPDDLRPALCFAPGTSEDYIIEMTTRYGRGDDPIFHLGDGVTDYRDRNRWTTTATNGSGLTRGQPCTITWSYVPDGTTIPGNGGEPASASSLFAWLNGIYSGGFNEWHGLFQQIFDRWSALSGITYVYQPTDDGATFPSSAGAVGVRGDVRISAHPIDGNFNILAYNFFPNTGDMVIDAGDSFFTGMGNNSRRFRNVVAHEHGHGIGFNHVCPINQTKLMEPIASTSFDGPQHDDTLGGQRQYGDDLEDNDTAATASAIAATVTLDDVSIDDASDVDYYRFTAGSGASATVTMTPIGFTYLEGPQNSNGSCSAGTSFNSLTLNDLGIQLIGSNGTTVLATANGNPAGQPETLTNIALPSAGSYFVRVSGGGVAEAQLYRLALTVTGGSFPTGAELVTGPGPGPSSAALVTEWAHDYSTKAIEFAAYGSSYGTNVAAGDINGAGLDEVVTGAGPSGVNGPQVKAYNAATATPVTPLVNFFAYGTLRFGANVAAGDVDGDGRDEILTGAGPGAVFGPHVRGWNHDGSALVPIGGINFFAYGTLKWGVNVGRGDVDGGADDMLTGSGPSAAFGPQVRGFKLSGGTQAMGKVNFFAFTGTTHGVRVEGGNYDADGFDEIVAGAGPSVGNATTVRGFDFDNGSISQQMSFTAFGASTGGAHVTAGDLDASQAGDEIAVSFGGLNVAATASVRGFRYDGASSATQVPPDFAAYSGNTYGATLAVAEVGAF